MKQGGVISQISPLSPTKGLKPGDRLLAINGQSLQDLLDYFFLSAGEERLTLTVQSGENIRQIKIRKDADESLGLDFTTELFDMIKTCPGKCIFCFMDQNPKEARSSLRLKDDDYRLSFLHGNYLTLHNFNSQDLARIKNYHLSPLYISIHATDPSVRELIFGSPACREIIPKLKKLVKAGVDLNLQIVLIPGINDREILDQTLNDLEQLGSALNSIAVVPVGLTCHRQELYPLTPVNREKAKEVIEQLAGWQKKFKELLGTKLVFPADEFFLIADLSFPSYGYYEGFPQLEDGVGLSRWFITGFSKIAHHFKKAEKPQKLGLITGEMGGKVLSQALAFLPRREKTTIEILPVKNRFFGESVTVTGLLAGRDILATIKEKQDYFDRFILPQVCLKDSHLFLDDFTIEELRREVRNEISIIPVAPGALMKAMVK